MIPIVTKDWLADKVAIDPIRTIGRALLAIYNQQLQEEKSNTVTVMKNGVGFSKPDARMGSIGARQFEKSGDMQPWLVKVWSGFDKTGYPRVCKYADQLNEIAMREHVICSSCLGTGWSRWFDEMDVPCSSCDGRGFHHKCLQPSMKISALSLFPSGI